MERLAQIGDTVQGYRIEAFNNPGNMEIYTATIVHMITGSVREVWPDTLVNPDDFLVLSVTPNGTWWWC